MTRRAAATHDASLYQIEPWAVVPRRAADIAIIDIARDLKVPVLPRGADDQCGQTVGAAWSSITALFPHLWKFMRSTARPLAAGHGPGTPECQLKHTAVYPVDVSTTPRHPGGHGR